mmetsp:Transcript_35621/g.93477  ORF Transcript_35621/g.93477 Transcript_35621/m.93477 type:complete len:202 (+) Transcript_35621:80-685(+)
MAAAWAAKVVVTPRTHSYRGAAARSRCSRCMVCRPRTRSHCRRHRSRRQLRTCRCSCRCQHQVVRVVAVTATGAVGGRGWESDGVGLARVEAGSLRPRSSRRAVGRSRSSLGMGYSSRTPCLRRHRRSRRRWQTCTSSRTCPSRAGREAGAMAEAPAALVCRSCSGYARRSQRSRCTPCKSRTRSPSRRRRSRHRPRTCTC